VDGLREKLREFFREEARAEVRAVAALNNVELITALISFNWQLALVGLQLRILNGVVSLLTTEVHNKLKISARATLFAQIGGSCTTALAAISPTLSPFGRTWLMGKKSGYECSRRFPTTVRSRSESMCV